MSGMATAIGASALIGAGTSIYMNESNKGNEGAGGYSGPQVVTMPTYSYDEPMRTLQSEHYMNQTRQQQDFFEKGNLPPWLQKTSDFVRRSLTEPLKETFYGSPMGGQGIYDTVRSAGAAAGIGPSPMMRQTMKAGQEYARRSQAIDETIAKLGATSMMGMYETTGNMMNRMPQGPPAQVLGGMPMQQRPDYMGDAMAGVASSLPWLAQGMWGGEQQNTTTDPWHTDPTVGRTGPPMGQSYEEAAYNQRIAAANPKPVYSSGS